MFINCNVRLIYRNFADVSMKILGKWCLSGKLWKIKILSKTLRKIYDYIFSLSHIFKSSKPEQFRIHYQSIIFVLVRFLSYSLLYTWRVLIANSHGTTNIFSTILIFLDEGCQNVANSFADYLRLLSTWFTTSCVKNNLKCSHFPPLKANP